MYELIRMSFSSAKPKYTPRPLNTTRNKYAPKFRVPNPINTSYKAPAGQYNIFPNLSDPVGYNSNASYTSNPRTLNLYTGINEGALKRLSNVPKYIKKGPRTILNPNWINSNPMPKGPRNLMEHQGPIIPWNRFGPRSRKTRRSRR